jgi:phospholipid/cholesterol/gamma-HCH transport system substrate-binding protein
VNATTRRTRAVLGGTRTRVVAVLTAVALLVSGCGFQGLYTATWLPGGTSLGNHPYTVHIMFADVLDLVPNSNVKVNDVAVGKVTGVKLSGWQAEVTVKVRSDVHLPANAIANVQQTSLLGEKFVQLAQPTGTPEGTLANNDTIPLTRTGSAPDVEEVLGALALLLNEGGLQQIQTIATELNNAFSPAGNADAIRDLLTQMNTFVSDLDTQKDKITNALVQIDRLAASLNQQKKSLTDALDSFPGALKILSDEEPQFTKLLQSLANLGNVATRVIDATDTSLTQGLKSLSPVLEQLTAAGSNLPKALNFLLTFPFPVPKATEFLKTDYANLALHLDVDLNDNLCGLNVPGLCDLINSLLPQKPVKAGATSSKSSSKTANTAATNSAAVTPLPLSALPGLGG